MSKWQGLDSAGVEFLWQEDVLRDVLKIFSAHEPVSHSDPHSPIYPDLDEAYDQYTWYKGDGGDFRPIFRRANPLRKIGLIEGDGGYAETTELGQNLLDGEIQLDEVFQATLALFAENDGTRSFARMARAGLKMPVHEFVLADIEFAVSEIDEDWDNLAERIASVRAKKLRVGSAGNRARKLRSFMTALVNSGAFAPTESGWVLHSEEAAYAITGDFDAVDGANDAEQPFGELVTLGTREISEGKRTPPKVSANKLSKLKPEERAALLDKANAEHELLVELAATEIRKAGGIPTEGVVSYDVACEAPVPLMLEAKSLSKKNAVTQIRKAIAQLPEYRWKHKQIFDEDTAMIVALSDDPRPLVGNDYIEYVENDRGMPVIWRAKDRLVDRHGKQFLDYLAQP